MKPYLVHKTWIDLDHVVAISSEVCHVAHISCGDGWLCSFTGHCEIIYRENAFTITLADGGRNFSDASQADILKEAQARLDAFVWAWRTGELTPYGSTALARGGGGGGGGGQ